MSFPYPHNIFIEIGAELGIIGISLFLILIISVINYSFKQWKDSKLDSYNILCQASFVLMIIAAQFSYDIPRNGLISVFGGILLAERTVEMGK
jgi:O-antigen ligase